MSAARWSVRGHMLTGLLSVAILVGGFTAWALSAQISGAVVATGQVEVERQRQVVQHLDGGVVATIAVRDGQAVEAGDVLLSLDGELLRSERTIVESQYFEILARRGRLEAERADAPVMEVPPQLLEAAERDATYAKLISGQESLFLTRRDTLRQSLDQLAQLAQQIDAEVDGIDAQITALATQRDLIARELKDQQSLLDRGLAQASRVLGLEREAARLDGQVGALQAERAAALIRQRDLEIQRLRLSAERREEAETQLSDVGYRELELAERRRSLTEQIGRLEIRAPVAGIVYNMHVTTPRSVIRSADPLLYIIPQDRPLVITARIATINIDEIQLGQPVAMRFSAFSSRTTPELMGSISRISADILVDEATRSPYYQVEVSIMTEELQRLGDLALVPGMPVEVYVQTGERTPMAYLLKPFADYFHRAFRES